jgi:DNA-binding NtrC family response regulator
MSRHATIDTAVKATRLGAMSFLEKPINTDALLIAVETALRLQRAETEARELRAASGTTGELVGESAAIKKLVEQIGRAAKSSASVLVTGERGTGKELVARAIHLMSPRAKGPLEKLNCAALPSELIESELFGHEAGAFTGATKQRRGKFERASGGTLFLDEVGDMPLPMQAKLLRVLQEREVEPLGASKPLPLDVRVVATSNRDLEQAVRDGAFREDLYYRLSVFPLRIAPLRERPGDIGALAERFLAARALRPCCLSPAALARLKSYPWPGNVRELENVIQRALLVSDGAAEILPEHLILSDARVAPPQPSSDLAGELWEEETRRIVVALETNRGTRRLAAEQLGISDRTLRYKLSKMRAAGIAVPGDRTVAEVVR